MCFWDGKWMMAPNIIVSFDRIKKLRHFIYLLISVIIWNETFWTRHLKSKKKQLKNYLLI